MAEPDQQSAIDRLGRMVSAWVADIAGTPAAQIVVILVCALWFAFGFADALLTAVLSILAITLTQMVLNQQKAREAEAHRRDVAMHAKLDELLIAMKGARDEMAGIEELDEEEIEVLKEEVKESIDQAGHSVGNDDARASAKRAAESAVERTAGVKNSRARRVGSERKA